MDAITLLVNDHHEVDMLFGQYEGAKDAPVKARLAEEICKQLTVHATIEEELFYPKAREVLDDNDDEMVDEAEEEHSEAKEMIATIRAMSTGPELDTKMKELQGAIKHHVTEEEEEMFPKLKELGMEMTKLGTEMAQRKSQLLSTL